MKAAILTKLNAPLELWDLELPWRADEKHCATGQALVDVHASGICGAQLKEIGGEKGNADFLPHLMGHEGVGVVREVGPGVNAQLVGKKVVMHWRKGVGAEAFHTARYINRQTGREVGGGHVTTLCEKAIVSGNRITPVDEDIPNELCALLGCGMSTALGTIEMEAQLRMGETCLIVGVGGVGLNLIQAARIKGASAIVAMDIVDEKAESCARLGATKYINAKTESIRDAMHLLGIKGFDVIVDTSGSVDALEGTIPLLSGIGRYVMVGQPKPGESFRIMAASDMFHGEGKRIIATQGGRFNPTVDIPRYIAMWRAGLIDLGGIVSHNISLDEVNTGIDLVRKGQAGRIMVQMK